MQTNLNVNQSSLHNYRLSISKSMMQNPISNYWKYAFLIYTYSWLVVFLFFLFLIPLRFLFSHHSYVRTFHLMCFIMILFDIVDNTILKGNIRRSIWLGPSYCRWHESERNNFFLSAKPVIKSVDMCRLEHISYAVGPHFAGVFLLYCFEFDLFRCYYGVIHFSSGDGHILDSLKHFRSICLMYG